MTAPKQKPSETANPKRKPSDTVKENIARQRQRSEGTQAAEFFETARKAQIFKTYDRFTKCEFPITAPELARLAMARKAGKPLSEITDFDLDEMLQFIARCQWRIEATKHFWGGYGNAFYEEDRDEAEPTEAIKRIREEPTPISFQRGLTLIGIRERPQKKGESASDARTRHFRPIFFAWYVEGQKIKHQYPPSEIGVTINEARSLDSWIPPTEKEILAAYKKKIAEGWPNPNQLELLAKRVAEWNKKNKSETNARNAKRRAKKGDK